ncbi:hypothetical protein DL771_000601 [Monosporascus sp. 5C6A]|nr:hypothetical protein DL771_000601 [Monosporascus sp. 5C6A]
MLTQQQIESMNFQHCTYPESLQVQEYIDSTTMGSAGDLSFAPNLKAPMSPPHVMDPCDPPQIQRFLADSCGSTYFGYHEMDTKVQGVLTAEPSVVAPIPSATHHRHSSPSFTYPSSTCSSALSPSMENDYSQAHSPPTPADTPLWPPVSSQYETWGSHGQLYQYTGLADDCVKPLDVNPYQENLHGLYEDNSARPSLLLRGVSMSSDASNPNPDEWNHCEANQLPRQMSPEALSPAIKDEIFIPESSGVYPPIDMDDGPLSADETEPTSTKIEDEDDEYQPNRRHKRPSPHASRNNKAQKRSYTSQNTSHAKRIKTELSDSLGSVNTAKASLKGAKRSFPCSQCPEIAFKDENGLQKHIKTQHTRPFICVFHFAGCKSTFASKNEWKRHCSSQHLLLNYWLCQQDQCAKVANSPHTLSGSWQDPRSACYDRYECVPPLPNGAIFNRKDLYTQHLRRMHVPPNVKKQVKQKKQVPEWEDSVRSYQEAAHRIRCHLPTYMDCPAPGCRVKFEGTNAWDERMEHVAKHLDRAGLGVESPISFGGDHDSTLIEWATRPDVSIIRRDGKGRWELHNPLKPAGSSQRKGMQSDEDEDAEGEEFHE